MQSKWKVLLIVNLALPIMACSDTRVELHDSLAVAPLPGPIVADENKFERKTKALCAPIDELKELLKLHNKSRRQGLRCGGKQARKTTDLKYSCALADASLQHARDMAENNYFSHESLDGLNIGERAAKSTYAWRRIGENMAKGFSSAQMANQAWLGSEGHCENIMNPSYTEMGAATVDKYWVVMFGSR